MGECSVISGVIVNPASIYWPATGSVNSFPFVGGSGSGGGGSGGGGGGGSGSGGGGGCDDMHCRYGATICKMQGRYGATICKTRKQKRPRAICSWPLIRYFTFVV